MRPPSSQTLTFAHSGGTIHALAFVETPDGRGKTVAAPMTLNEAGSLHRWLSCEYLAAAKRRDARMLDVYGRFERDLRLAIEARSLWRRCADVARAA